MAERDADNDKIVSSTDCKNVFVCDMWIQKHYEYDVPLDLLIFSANSSKDNARSII